MSNENTINMKSTSSPLRIKKIELNSYDATAQAPCTELLPGHTIDGFEIKDFIRETSMINIYNAIQLSDKKPVVIRIIKPELSESEEHIDIFLKETKILACLDHPQILKSIKSGHIGSIYYSVMESIDGPSLNEFISQQCCYKEKKALRHIILIAEALKHGWNSHRVVHCNIKPSSIFLSKTSEIIVASWNNAKFAYKQKTGYISGSPQYMSPEQTKGHPLDFFSDIFSLGVFFYELICGEKAFSGKSAEEIFLEINTKMLNLEPIKEKNISDCTIKLIQKMTAKEPGDRFHSWEELIQEAHKCLKNSSHLLSHKPKKSLKIIIPSVQSTNN